MENEKSFVWIGVIALVLGIGILVGYYVFYREPVVIDSRLSDETRLELDAEVSETSEFSVAPSAMKIEHHINIDSCPNQFDGRLVIEGPAGGSWSIDEKSIPDWLDVPQVNGAFPASLEGIAFNCQVELVEKTVTAQLNFQAKDATGFAVDQLFTDIIIDLVAYE